MSLASNATGNLRSTLVRHAARPQWGRAVMAWARGNKRAYQFEDGQLRVFAEGYFHMLEPTAPSEDTAAVLATLTRASGVADVPGKRTSAPSTTIKIDDQLELLTETFEGAFGDAAWTKKYRGGSGRRLKRHREPLIADAKAKLAATVLEAGIDREDWSFVIDQFVGVLAASDLVTKKHLTALRDARPSERLARALRDLLHGAGEFDERLRDAIVAMCKDGAAKPSWALVTAMLAAFDPEQHVYVRTTTFKAQGTVFGTKLKLGTVPRAHTYAQCLAVARSTFEALAKRGHTPRDMFDVTEFINLTMSPKARKELAARTTDAGLH